MAAWLLRGALPLTGAAAAVPLQAALLQAGGDKGQVFSWASMSGMGKLQVRNVWNAWKWHTAVQTCPNVVLMRLARRCKCRDETKGCSKNSDVH